ncbi:hypothetical protein RR42_s3194 [Cupriavidus basilensis]|uniref:Uncharacterized protein n=1 Tax=Cupriavidus basilensis TaxID=68895 RepID=A0A0C4YQN6_9BURK|nr:hypothetical protein RR42_s3194 [Cupriavidus basilensis]
MSQCQQHFRLLPVSSRPPVAWHRALAAPRRCHFREKLPLRPRRTAFRHHWRSGGPESRFLKSARQAQARLIIAQRPARHGSALPVPLKQRHACQKHNHEAHIDPRGTAGLFP